MLGQRFGRELIMNHLQRVGDHIVLLCQGSERSQNGVVNVFKQQNSIKWIDDLSDTTCRVLFITASSTHANVLDHWRG